MGLTALRQLQGYQQDRCESCQKSLRMPNGLRGGYVRVRIRRPLTDVTSAVLCYGSEDGCFKPSYMEPDRISGFL